MQYRVAWQSKATGFQSHGQWIDSRVIVDAWVTYGNREHPYISHWVEQGPLSAEQIRQRDSLMALIEDNGIALLSAHESTGDALAAVRAARGNK